MRGAVNDDWLSMYKMASRALGDISKSDSIHCWYGADADGMVSIGIIITLLQKQLGVESRRITKSSIDNYGYDMREPMGELRSSLPDAVIGVDIPIHQAIDALTELDSLVLSALFYDHHVMKEGTSFLLSLKKILYLNSRIIGYSCNHPASYFAYCISEELGAPIPSWLVSAGLHGDRALERYPEIVKKVEPSVSYRKLCTLLNAVGRFHDEQVRSRGIQAVMRICGEQLSWKEFEDSYEYAELTEYSECISDDVRKEVSRILRRTSISENLIIDIAHSPYFIAGVIASIIASQRDGTIVAIAQTNENRTQIEFRLGKNASVDLINVLQVISDKVATLSFGGHPAAAGMLIEGIDAKDVVAAVSTVLSKIHGSSV